MLVEHRRHIAVKGEDLPEIRAWRWRQMARPASVKVPRGGGRGSRARDGEPHAHRPRPRGSSRRPSPDPSLSWRRPASRDGVLKILVRQIRPAGRWETTLYD